MQILFVSIYDSRYGIQNRINSPKNMDFGFIEIVDSFITDTRCYMGHIKHES